MLARQVQSIKAVRGGQGGKPRAVQLVADEVDDIGFVVDDQHGVLHRLGGRQAQSCSEAEALASNDFVTKRNPGRTRHET